MKGGMLLAAYDARRPTADLDALARSIANDQEAILVLVSEIVKLPLDDGVQVRTATATSRIIRDQAVYSGVRIAMDSTIATATVKFRLDVNFGDPVTPAPDLVTLPSLRPGMEPVRVLGYPVETILAEKIATAIALGPANTRVRDYADIYTLTGMHAIAHHTARRALLATAAYRGMPVQPLSNVIGNFVDVRRQTFDAYRMRLGDAGLQIPQDLKTVVRAVTTFADPLTRDAAAATWHPTKRHWRRGRV
jgi:hypothetical protein